MRDLFDAAGLPRPSLPLPLVQRLRPPTMAGRETAGWPATLDFEARWRQALHQPTPIRAWITLSPGPAHHLAAVAATVIAEAAVFIRRRWSVTPETQALDRQRITSAWTLMEHLLDCTGEAVRRGRWPSRQRLLLVDDDFGLRRWGWERHQRLPESAMAEDPMALLHAAAEADRLLGTPAAAWDSVERSGWGVTPAQAPRPFR